MDKFIDEIKSFLPQVSDTLVLDIITTLLLFIGVMLFKTLMIRIFSSQTRLAFEIRKRRAIHIRNLMIFVFVIGVIFIWSKEIHALALSFVALGFAIVFAFKEVISSANWEIFRSATNAYTVGDYIEINGMRGVVLDHNFLSTTIQELGPGKRSNLFSGRSITIPNSTFLLSPLINESYMKEYILHTLTIPMTTDDEWEKAEEILLEVANTECEDYLSHARTHFDSLRYKINIAHSTVEPRVAIELPEPNEIDLVLRFPTPFSEKWNREQAILKRFLRKYKSNS
ncbi:MAG: membrane protein [Thermodesulfobacteriota bacterium]|nr:MAG: membrane protein [Thermodesulfobacteriota bacterium]